MCSIHNDKSAEKKKEKEFADYHRYIVLQQCTM